MSTPRININLWKIAYNAKTLNKIYAAKGIEVIGVTKAVGGDPVIADILIKSGIRILADSRMINIIRMHNAGIKAKFMLLRSPFLNQVNKVVKYVDISLNSELTVIRKISRTALKNNLKHKIILMIETGDLREGIMPSKVNETVEEIMKLKGVELTGIGTNLACLGGIKPDQAKMNQLSSIADEIEKIFNIQLTYISGGNSANYDWFMENENIGRINNLRIGESIFLGRETLNRNKIPGMYTDAFTIVSEVIESKTKPSLPYGNAFQNAFGDIPEHKDTGKMRRVILGIGKQDTDISGLTPICDTEIVASSSDHTVVKTKREKILIGDYIKFIPNYGALQYAMTSRYLTKNFMNIMNVQEYCNMIERNYYDNEMKVMNIQREDNESPLVSLKDTEYNLLFDPFINKNYAYSVRKELVEKIGRISKKLEEDNKQLIILSAWRSENQQKMKWHIEFDYIENKYKNKSFQEIIETVSKFYSLYEKSNYSSGGSVDALIYDLKENRVLDFGCNTGTKIDLGEKCYPYYPDISIEAKENRKLLMGLFLDEGFVCSINEFWHFHFGNVNWALAKGLKNSIYDTVYY